MIERALLIGNGPSVLDYDAGELIDSFNGFVCRFNHCPTKGREKQIGTRTDIWFTTGPNPLGKSLGQVATVYHTWSKDKRDNGYAQVQAVLGEDKALGYVFEHAIANAQLAAGVDWPSTGLIVAVYMVESGNLVCIHGFDHSTKQYAFNQADHKNHDWDAERAWFDRMIEQGKITRLIEQ